MNDEKCQNCKFFLIENSNYECHRYPPNYLNQSTLAHEHSYFPEILDLNWWCGEWKPRSED
jgi:hypothetical protein